jgi:hypothetical protein
LSEVFFLYKIMSLPLGVPVYIFCVANEGYLTSNPQGPADIAIIEPSPGTGSEWVLSNSGGGIQIQNTTTQTYLSVCYTCNNIPGYSVDSHSSTPANWTTWNLSPSTLSNNIFTIQSAATGGYLEICGVGAQCVSNGIVNVDLSGSPNQTSSLWALIESGGVPPLPLPIPPTPPTPPIPPPMPPASSKNWAILTSFIFIGVAAFALLIGAIAKKGIFMIFGLLFLLVGFGFGMFYVVTK